VSVGVNGLMKKADDVKRTETMLKDYGYSEKTVKEILRWYVGDS
jgi:hypothetical protein